MELMDNLPVMFDYQRGNFVLGDGSRYSCLLHVVTCSFHVFCFSVYDIMYIYTVCIYIYIYIYIYIHIYDFMAIFEGQKSFGVVCG